MVDGQVVVALAKIDTLDTDTATNAVAERIGALGARVAETMALRDAGVTPVALHYLLARMQTELSGLRAFAGSLRSGRMEDRSAAAGTETPSQPEVTT